MKKIIKKIYVILLIRDSGIKILLTGISLLLFLSPVDAAEKSHIAVVKSQYDDIGRVLKNYRIDFNRIDFFKLQNYNTLQKYQSLFLPCGSENGIEESVHVMALNTRIRSVTLKKNYRKIDYTKIIKNIRKFILNGGAVYFSGYSFRILQDAFHPFSFFDNFPYMGMPGRVEAACYNDLFRFRRKKMIAFYFDTYGWIAIKKVADAEILSKGSFATPRGVHSGPISCLLYRGEGEIIYTSYDSTLLSDFRRFNVYRIAGASLMKRLIKKTKKWEGEITVRIADALHKHENFREYRIDLKKGKNTIYFFAEKGTFQVDLIDNNFSIIESRELHRNNEKFLLEAQKKGWCTIRVYPDTSRRFAHYVIMCIHGQRSIPYFKPIIIIISVLFLIGLILIVRVFIFKRSSSSRFKYTFFR